MTNSTSIRHENLRCLVAEFQSAEMSQAEICAIFNCSRSGARVYLACLGDLIEERFHGLCKPRTYVLTADQSRVDAFLASLGEVKPRLSRGRKPRSIIESLRRDPTRHIHIMADDAPFRVPVCNARPVHDGLHSAFWAGRAAA